jgi:hypothetical protein
MTWKTLDDLDLAGRIVLTRVDINVPVEDGRVTDATRIERIVPTVKDILAKGGKAGPAGAFRAPQGQGRARDVSETGRARARGRARAAGGLRSRRPTALRSRRCQREASLLLENTRFHAGEEKNDPDAGPVLCRARRRLLQRRLLGRAPGPCLDRGHRASPAVLRRAADGGGTEGARGGARRPSGRFSPWWAAPRSRPSSTCWAT